MGGTRGAAVAGAAVASGRGPASGEPPPSSLRHPHAVIDAGSLFVSLPRRAAASRCALARYCLLSFAPTAESRPPAAGTD
eukprot:16449416-Heterocapsa_arctica.AAC.1